MAKTARGEENQSQVSEEISSTSAQASTIETHPTQEEIGERAYEIYLARGGADGSAEDDWLQAEQELIASAGTVQDTSE